MNEIKCSICFGKSGDLTSLQNNEFVHAACLSLGNDIEISDIASELSNMEAQLSSIKPNYSFFGKIFGDEKEDKRVARERPYWQDQINLSQLRLNDALEKKQNYLEVNENKIQEAVIYWPGYPPEHFWQQIRSKVISKSKQKCQGCRRRTSEGGQVHHKIPLSMGGTNEIGNLVYLCVNCHQKRHSHKFSYKQAGSYDKTASQIKKKKQYKDLNIKERLDLAQSRNSKIWIQYVDENGEITDRWVRVINRFKEKKVPRREYVEVHCYMRDDKRTFRLDRIKRASQRELKT